MTKNLTLNEIFILTKFIKAVSRLDDETEKLIRENAGISEKEMNQVFDKL